jgi:hypothetical protein
MASKPKMPRALTAICSESHTGGSPFNPTSVPCGVMAEGRVGSGDGPGTGVGDGVGGGFADTNLLARVGLSAPDSMSR